MSIYANDIFNTNLSPKLSTTAQTNQEQINTDSVMKPNDNLSVCIDAYRQNPSWKTSTDFSSVSQNVPTSTSRFSSQSSVLNLKVGNISSDKQNNVVYYRDIFKKAHDESSTYAEAQKWKPEWATWSPSLSSPEDVREVQRIMRYVWVTEEKQECLTCLDWRFGVHTISRLVSCLPWTPCDNVNDDFVYWKYMEEKSDLIIQKEENWKTLCCYEKDANLTAEEIEELKVAGIEACPEEENKCEDPLKWKEDVDWFLPTDPHYCCIEKSQCKTIPWFELNEDWKSCDKLTGASWVDVGWDKNQQICENYLSSISTSWSPVTSIPLCPEPEPECVKKDDIETRCKIEWTTTKTTILEAKECTDIVTNTIVPLCCDNGTPPEKDTDGNYTCTPPVNDCKVQWSYVWFSKTTCCFDNYENANNALKLLKVDKVLVDPNKKDSVTWYMPWVDWYISMLVTPVYANTNTDNFAQNTQNAIDQIDQQIKEDSVNDKTVFEEWVKVCPDEDKDDGCTPKDDEKIDENGKCVCDPTKWCCGIELNTYVPFVCDQDPQNDSGTKRYRCCIQFSNSNQITTDDSTTQVNQLNAFPFLIGGLMKILMVVILVTWFGSVVVWGMMMTIPDQFTNGKNLIIHVVVAMALLWVSWVILFMINPNFFR